MRGENYSVISVIGDGALTGGMAYEALNNAAQIKKNFIIVLNDNNMSISKNVGGISRYLSNLRADEGYNELKKSVVAALRSIPMVGNGMVQTLTRTKMESSSSSFPACGSKIWELPISARWTAMM